MTRINEFSKYFISDIRPLAVFVIRFCSTA